MANSTEKLRSIPYAARRQHFFSELLKGAENVVAIIPAHPELVRNNDVHFKFRQDSNFYYLTGFEEPDAIAVFRAVGGKKEFILFVRPKDLAQEIWTGYRTGVDGAVSKLGADRSYSVDDFDAQMPKLLHGAERVYYGLHKTLNYNGVEYLDAKIPRMIEDHRKGFGRSGRGLLPIYDPHEILGEMRLLKSPDEIDRLRKASQITANAHCEIIQRCRPGLYEYQVEAMVEYFFRFHGATRMGYNSIVASGHNATILHYIENSRRLEDGDLLLLDAGAECDYYTSDITRTFAVNGKMTAPQRELYDIVLKVQKECVAMAKPGATLVNIHNFAVEELTDAMVTLKFLSGDRKKLVETLAYKRYYPHGTGHLLGMDVHDVGLYQTDGQPRKLQPGMVFTVEPGFYVLFDDNQVPDKYRGIGIRVEDDVLITPEGCEVLTSGVPKEVDDMAAMTGTKPLLG
ncbi:MAG: aminopeptidase P N-terminal domain-containing protein [Bdellovibrionota bacterium]